MKYIEIKKYKCINTKTPHKTHVRSYSKTLSQSEGLPPLTQNSNQTDDSLQKTKTKTLTSLMYKEIILRNTQGKDRRTNIN